MAAILQMTSSNAFCWTKMFKNVSIKISLKFVPKSPINNIPALVQIMAWCRQGDKAIIWTNDGLHYWRIYASLGPN